MGSWFQRELGPGTSWYQASEWTHAGQEEGGLQDAFSICRAILRWDFFLCHGGGSRGEAFSSCFLQDIPATPDSWFPLGS